MSEALLRKGIEEIEMNIYRVILLCAILVNYALIPNSVNGEAIDEYINQAEIYHQKRECDKAIAELNKALALEPQNAEIYRMLGGNYILKRQFNDALSAFKKGLQIDPNSAMMHAGLSVTYNGMKMFDEGIQEAQKALLIDPKCVEAHTALAISYFSKGMTGEAIQAAKRALELDPNSSDLHVMLMSIYATQKKYDLALSHAKTAGKLGDSRASSFIRQLEKESGEVIISPFVSLLFPIVLLILFFFIYKQREYFLEDKLKTEAGRETISIKRPKGITFWGIGFIILGILNLLHTFIPVKLSVRYYLFSVINIILGIGILHLKSWSRKLLYYYALLVIISNAAFLGLSFLSGMIYAINHLFLFLMIFNLLFILTALLFFARTSIKKHFIQYIGI